MKMSPEMKKAQENMISGVLSAEGFLGEDEGRPLRDLIEETEELFSHHGLDIDELTTLLEELMEEGRKGLGEPITVRERWLVQTTEARGHLPCPFEDGIQRKITALIQNKANEESLLVSSLSLHLLMKHHFIEGRGSRFRMEPEQVKLVLDHDGNRLSSSINLRGNEF